MRIARSRYTGSRYRSHVSPGSRTCPSASTTHLSRSAVMGDPPIQRIVADDNGRAFRVPGVGLTGTWPAGIMDSRAVFRPPPQHEDPGIMSDRTEPTKQAAARLAAIVTCSDDAIIGLTPDGVITSWNRAAERLFGYTAGEALGQPIGLIVPEDRRPEGDNALGRVLRGEHVEHFETVRMAKDGRRVDISLTISPVRDSRGHIIGASKAARDISDRHTRETARTAPVAREPEARAELETITRGHDEFLAVLSHELRTPLNAIYGWARMLQGGLLDAETQQRAIEAIIRNATAQVQLVEDMLDISRITTGNMRLDVRPVDLKSVIEAALDTVRPAANAKSIRLQTVLDPRPGIVMGEPDRLQQVVWNLLINAVKFTPRFGRVQVHLRRVDTDAEIVVTDTGEGISADLLPFIFDRFRQGDSSASTRPHSGLGIGLALVRHLVDLHGGTVRAESPGPGQGATFTVTLPVALVQAAAPPAEERVGEGRRAGSAERTALRGARIMLVDDDADG